MRIANYDLQPVMLYLPEGEKWKKRAAETFLHLKDNGITGIWHIPGVDADRMGVTAARPYLRDHPEENYHIRSGVLGNYLSHYMLYNMMATHREVKHWLLLEDDVRLNEGWRTQLFDALCDVPQDFDWLFVGHCCCEGRESRHIKGNVWEVKYPLATHCSIIASKCLPTLISTCTNACQPIDVSLFDNTFELLKVYTILPRLAEQGEETFLPK